MTRIHTNEFESYNKKLFAEFIRLTETDCFQIIIPRRTYEFSPDDFEWLSHEFILCGYAGQLLCENVSKFGYSVPDPFSSDSVIFDVTVNKNETASFTHALYEIVKCAINDGRDVDSHNAFWYKACEFYEDFTEGELKHTAGLLEVACMLLKDAGNKAE